MKHVASNFVKLDKFEGVYFRRWQKKMHFLLFSMSVVYVLTTPIPDDDDDVTVDQLRKRAKWDNDDYVCRGLILIGMSDSLFDIYQNVESLKELWDSLKAKYMADDASSKKFLVSCIIDKLPPSWKDFKHTLKHLKEELTLVELGSHLRIEESLMMHECYNNPQFLSIIMSSSTHPIILYDFDVEDAFSSTNIPNSTPASPNYSPASSGNTFLDPLEKLNQNLLVALVISPFHDDIYMKVMQAYNAELPIQAPIAPPPSLTEESSHKTPSKRHEEQIETILNHLDELPLERIKEMEDKIRGIRNGRVFIQRDFDRLETELEKARTQIVGLQKKQIGHDDEVVLACIRIFTLEIIIEDIQVRHRSDISFFIIAVQTPGSGIFILLAVGTPSTGSGNLYFQWELSPGSRNALCILFPT
nr:zinc finger, CCHC-type [Tanacetum cinerariifolium]